MRTLTNEERQAILTLAAGFESDSERKQLLADIDNCTVKDTVSDGSILAFDIGGYQRPSNRGRGHYRAKGGFEIEGTMTDADGAELQVLLLADSNHRIWEFEIVRYHSGSVIQPDWSTFKTNKGAGGN